MKQVLPCDSTTRQVEYEFKGLVDRGFRIKAAGAAREDSLSLLSMGYTPKHKVELFGVTFYLTNATIVDTLVDIASTATRGSELVFDYLDARLLDARPPFRGAKRLAAMARRRGEPFLSGLTPRDLGGVLRRAGFELVEHFVGAEQARLHSARDIGIFPPSEYIHLARARVL